MPSEPFAPFFYGDPLFVDYVQVVLSAVGPALAAGVQSKVFAPGDKNKRRTKTSKKRERRAREKDCVRRKDRQKDKQERVEKKHTTRACAS